jgi:hypothetical protein
MKIEAIKITVAARPEPVQRTQAYIMQYDMDQSRNMYPVYELGNNPPEHYVRGYHDPTINITCMCPRCATEFRMTVRQWNQRSIQMVCTCGLPLHVLPERRQERFANPGVF